MAIFLRWWADATSIFRNTIEPPQAQRQTGSSFKAYDYTAAMEDGL